MKLLIMCEGPNELAIIKILLENDCFTFTENDLLNLTPYHARQIDKSPQIRAALNIYPGNDIKILRISDKQNDELRIPKEYKHRITKVEKYCTKPELEILLIIAEGLLREFEKVKAHTTPKAFAKQYVKYNRTRYNNSTKFYDDYFGDDCRFLVDAIKQYRQLNGAHKKDELYLADLLK